MKNIILFLILIMSLPAGTTQLPLVTWTVNKNCGLQDYITKYNSLNPETQLFVEDLTKISAPTAMKDALIQIDHDEGAAHLAVQVVRCMVSPSRFLPQQLESTLKEAFNLYFTDRGSRRALRLFFTELDAAYLTPDQRAANLQRNTSWIVNATDAAVYGTWAASIALWLAKKGRGPSPLPRTVAMPKPNSSQGVSELEKIYSQASRWINLKQWLRNSAQIGALAMATGATGGSVTYIARKNGWLSKRTTDSLTELERVYHRMNWLELDCRARTLYSEVSAPGYDISKNNRTSQDARRINQLINDYNFMIDVSQLYYSEVEWPADFHVSGNTVTYKNIRLDCPVGFSKSDMRKVVTADVRTAVAQAGMAFFEKYSVFLYQPMIQKVEQLYQNHQAGILAALQKEHNQGVLNFLVHANDRVVSTLETEPDTLLAMISAFLGVSGRLEGRDAFLEKWQQAMNSIPEAARQAIDSLNREIIVTLPTPLLNQFILEQVSRQDLFPGNLVVLFQLGLKLEDAAGQHVIENKENYLLPHELLFYLYEDAGIPL